MATRLGALGPKVGPVLFQLPPRFLANRERLASFLKLLPKRYEYALEFRHEAVLAWTRSAHADDPGAIIQDVMPLRGPRSYASRRIFSRQRNAVLLLTAPHQYVVA